MLSYLINGCVCLLYCGLLTGVGRLIAESQVTPIVVPFWHEGECYVNLHKCIYTNLGGDYLFQALCQCRWLKKGRKWSASGTGSCWERKGEYPLLSQARLVVRPLFRLPPLTEFLEQAGVVMDVWLKHWTTKYNKESKGQIYRCKYMQIYETNIKGTFRDVNQSVTCHMYDDKYVMHAGIWPTPPHPYQLMTGHKLAREVGDNSSLAVDKTCPAMPHFVIW